MVVQHMARWMKYPLPPPPAWTPPPLAWTCVCMTCGTQGGQGRIDDTTGKGLRTAVALSTASCWYLRTCTVFSSSIMHKCCRDCKSFSPWCTCCSSGYKITSSCSQLGHQNSAANKFDQTPRAEINQSQRRNKVRTPRR